MIARAIVRSDAFCSMSPAAQLTYFHMVADADDDGVVGSTRGILSDAQAGPEALKELEAARFILPIGKVYAIKHWRIMNTLRKDRYHPSTYQDELDLLDLKPDGSYTYRRGGKPGENLGDMRLP